MIKNYLLILLIFSLGCSTTDKAKHGSDAIVELDLRKDVEIEPPIPYEPQDKAKPLDIGTSKEDLLNILGKPATIWNLGKGTNDTSQSEIWEYLLVVKNGKFTRFAKADEIEPKICISQAVVEPQPQAPSREDIGSFKEIKKNLDSFIADNKKNVSLIKINMFKSQVLDIMGYSRLDLGTKTISNPYKIEILDEVEVAFYYTEIKIRDDIVADDELTPLVFKDDRLVGIGYTYLENLKD